MLILVLGLALLICVLTAGDELRRRRISIRRLTMNPDELLEPIPDLPGRRGLAILTAFIVALLLAYSAALPVQPSGPISSLHTRHGKLFAAFSGIATAASLFLLLRQGWKPLIAHLGLALFSLAACTAATVFTPAYSWTAHPAALLIGLSMTAWLWSWLADVWHQQLDDGVAWTTAGRLVTLNRRFAAVELVLAALMALLLAAWPLWDLDPAIKPSLGRMIAGFFGLGLLLASIRRYVFRGNRKLAAILAVAVLLAIVGFLALRLVQWAV